MGTATRQGALATAEGRGLPLSRPWRARVRRLPWLSEAALGALLLVGILFYVWQHIQVVRLGYQVERLREERAALVQEGRELSLEVGRLSALRRIEAIARDELGMVKPRPGQVVVMP